MPGIWRSSVCACCHRPPESTRRRRRFIAVADDLFAAAAAETQRERAPLAARLRPQRLDDVVGQQHLLGPDAPLRQLIEADRLTSVILWGPPGSGKTTLARLIAHHTAQAFETLSAVSASVKDVRAVIDGAQRRLGEHRQGTILFLDEVHRFNRAQQDAPAAVRGGRPPRPDRRRHREPLLRGQMRRSSAARTCSDSTRWPTPTW